MSKVTLLVVASAVVSPVNVWPDGLVIGPTSSLVITTVGVVSLEGVLITVVSVIAGTSWSTVNVVPLAVPVVVLPAVSVSIAVKVNTPPSA